MKTRNLRDIEVSSIGMGCMGFTHGYGELSSEDEAIRIIRSAYEDYGCTYFDTAGNNGPYINERLVGKAVKPFRDKIVLATKFTPEIFFGGQEIPEGKTSRKGIRNALAAGLGRGMQVSCARCDERLDQSHPAWPWWGKAQPCGGAGRGGGAATRQ